MTCEIDAEHARIAQSLLRSQPTRPENHYPPGLPALETVSALKGEFDFVFLDADKENYVNYYEAVLPKLRPGADYWWPTMYCGQAKCSTPGKNGSRRLSPFNDRVARDARVEQVMLSVRDGILLVRKR